MKYHCLWHNQCAGFATRDQCYFEIRSGEFRAELQRALQVPDAEQVLDMYQDTGWRTRRHTRIKRLHFPVSEGQGNHVPLRQWNRARKAARRSLPKKAWIDQAKPLTPPPFATGRVRPRDRAC